MIPPVSYALFEYNGDKAGIRCPSNRAGLVLNETNFSSLDIVFENSGGVPAIPKFTLSPGIYLIDYDIIFEHCFNSNFVTEMYIFTGNDITSSLKDDSLTVKGIKMNTWVHSKFMIDANITPHFNIQFNYSTELNVMFSKLTIIKLE